MNGLKLINYHWTFHKNSAKDDLPLKLPFLETVNSVLKRQVSITFLGMMLGENILWKEHNSRKYTLQKHWFIIQSQTILDNESLKSIYFSYIHSYLNYANIAWASTNPTT